MQLDIGKLKFLVVDDNSHMRHIVRGLLHGLGGRIVFEAEDGAGGLEALQNRAPDILIVDCVMPVLDGIELVRMIRRPYFKYNPLIPIIMLTAYPERRRVLQALDAGVDELLCKPISARALHNRILSVVRHRRAFVQSKDYVGPDRRGRTESGGPVEIEAYLAERRSAPHGDIGRLDVAAPLGAEIAGSSGGPEADRSGAPDRPAVGRELRPS